jgi:5'-deoxynucleotidase YfbR-like HD superfamily hydrolase
MVVAVADGMAVVGIAKKPRRWWLTRAKWRPRSESVLCRKFAVTILMRVVAHTVCAEKEREP